MAAVGTHEGAESSAVTEQARELLADAATRGERLFSFARAAFCSLTLVRFIVIGVAHGNLDWFRVAVFVPPYLLALVASLVIIRRARWGLSEGWLYGSVIVDAVLCSAALAPNVLWPWPTYPGFTRLPDLGILYLIILSTGLRLSTGAAVVGSALNLVACAALIALDARLGQAAPQLIEGTSMVMIVGLGASSLAVLTAWRTRRLVERGALDSWRSAVAERSLGFLLEEQHDTKSALAAMRLQVDRIEDTNEPDAQFRLRTAFEALHESVVRAREHSFSTLAKLRGYGPVDFDKVTRELTTLLSLRFPGTRFSVEAVASPAPMIAGGEAVLQRVLYNLLLNACEGDGKTGASHVGINFFVGQDHLQVRVQDDGVGFDPALLARDIGCLTTKPNGTGLGLFVTAGMVTHLGGHLTRANTDQGGAVVMVTLPAQRSRR